jgi:thiol-disulfide isomerase/thioredoxin
VSTVSLLVRCAALLLGSTAGAVAVEPGERAPDFVLPAFAGPSAVRLSDYRGKVVLVDFWASWCTPCRQSLPLYEQMRARLPDTDFAILAVNLDEDPSEARAFLKEHPVHYLALQNPQGDVARAFGLIGMPSSYLIDRDGVVRARHVGFEPGDLLALQRQIADLLHPAPAHAP